MSDGAKESVERTDWADIGSICRTFGNERQAVTAIFSGRMTPGRNFWKEAADEIERLRATPPAAPADVLAGRCPDCGALANEPHIDICASVAPGHDDLMVPPAQSNGDDK